MTRTQLTAILITLVSQAAWADKTPDKSKFTTTIIDTLDKNGADCRVESHRILAETASEVIFSVKCSNSSYLKNVEVTCVKPTKNKCIVSGY